VSASAEPGATLGAGAEKSSPQSSWLGQPGSARMPEIWETSGGSTNGGTSGTPKWDAYRGKSPKKWMIKYG
jgi:hypothetical protein